MAPVNLSDDVAELSRCVGQLARVVLKGRPPGQLGQLGPSAGLSEESARAWMRGEILLPPRQGISLVNAILERERMQQVNYMTTLRAGHAGSDVMGASYVARVSETVALPRGRSEDRVWVRGGPLEASAGDVTATLARLAKDFPGWKPEADGAESLATDKPKLIWRARHADHGQVSGATSLDLAEKLAAIDADVAAEAKRAAAYARG